MRAPGRRPRPDAIILMPPWREPPDGPSPMTVVCVAIFAVAILTLARACA